MKYIVCDNCEHATPADGLGDNAQCSHCGVTLPDSYEIRDTDDTEATETTAPDTQDTPQDPEQRRRGLLGR